MAVGVCNGIFRSVAVALDAYPWFADMTLSLVIAIAILVKLIAAALSGLLIPLILEKFCIDPALSGSVVHMTVTDVIGILTFLGLGTVFLLS